MQRVGVHPIPQKHDDVVGTLVGVEEFGDLVAVLHGEPDPAAGATSAVDPIAGRNAEQGSDRRRDIDGAEMLGHDAAGPDPGPGCNERRPGLDAAERAVVPDTVVEHLLGRPHDGGVGCVLSVEVLHDRFVREGRGEFAEGHPLDRNLGLGPDALIKRLIPQRVVAGLGEDLDRPVGGFAEIDGAGGRRGAESVTGLHDHGVDVAGHGRIGEQRFEPGDGGIGEGHGRDRNPCRSPPPVDAADWRCWLTMPPNGLPWRP